MTTPQGYKHPAIAGSGTIACGLAATATALSDVVLLARSDSSAWQAEEDAVATCEKVEGGDPERLRVTTDLGDLIECDLIVEAISEDLELKGAFIGELAGEVPDADLASTTSSLSIAEIGHLAGDPARFYGLHVFNPVPQMKLVEICFPEAVDSEVRDRALAWCAALGKTAVEVPDSAGFVVNRLLFPYLFDAVRLLEQGGISAGALDTCMKLGGGHPMGPLALLDYVGIDVAVAIGEVLFAETGDPDHGPPVTLREMAAEGNLGRKTGSGFYDYE